MQIENIELEESHKGVGVIYTPRHKAPTEAGIISSWNDTFVFVKYGDSGTAQATDPEQLAWNTDHEYTSSCCGAPGPNDYGICTDCKEHCSFELRDMDGQLIHTKD